MANVSVTFSLLDPANNIIKKTDELEVWMHKPSPQKQDLELSVQYLSVKIGKKDSSGLYTVKALVNDKNSGRKLSLEKKFEVFE